MVITGIQRKQIVFVAGLLWEGGTRTYPIYQKDSKIFYKEDSRASEGFRIVILKMEGTDTSSLFLDSKALSWNFYCNYKHYLMFIMFYVPYFLCP